MTGKDILKSLANWEALNDALRDAGEGDAAQVLQAEKQGKRRIQYLLRIHSRMNKERGRRERSELLKLSGKNRG